MGIHTIAKAANARLTFFFFFFFSSFFSLLSSLSMAMIHFGRLNSHPFNDPFFGDIFNLDNCKPQQTTRRTKPGRLDAVEYDDRFELHVDMPGIPHDEIHVSVKDGMLQVRGGSDVKKEEKDEETGKVLFRERRQPSYSRSVHLPDTVDVEAITAKNSDGVLQLTLPKRKASEPQEHKIPVLPVLAKEEEATPAV